MSMNKLLVCSIIVLSFVSDGQTTNLNSKHSTDQWRLFANHLYKRAWFTEAGIKANPERKYQP